MPVIPNGVTGYESTVWECYIPLPNLRTNDGVMIGRKFSIFSINLMHRLEGHMYCGKTNRLSCVGCASGGLKLYNWRIRSQLLSNLGVWFFGRCEHCGFRIIPFEKFESTQRHDIAGSMKKGLFTNVPVHEECSRQFYSPKFYELVRIA